jgi:hypothetical protein
MNMLLPDMNMGAPDCALYPEGRADVTVLFDLRIPGAAERLHRERAVWQERSNIEALDEDHLVLILGSGEGTRLAA